MLTLLTGCYKQDYSLCGVDNNLVLSFKIEDGTRSGATDFAAKINSVDAVVFDADNRYVTSRRVTNEQLQVAPETKFTVAPGTYRIVCWANVSPERTSIPSFGPGMTLGECHVATISNQSGCPLWYAPNKSVGNSNDNALTDQDYKKYEALVTLGAVTEKEMIFTRAHRTVNVYILNYKHGKSAVELTNIPDRYDFWLQTYNTRKNYQKTTESVTTPDGQMELASFNAPITDFANDMQVHLKDPVEFLRTDGVNLKEWIDANIDKIKDINEINILFKYNPNGSVTIMVPSWTSKDVGPIW